MKLNKLLKKLLDISPDITALEKDGCICLCGEVDDYAKSVKAAKLAVDKKRYLGVLNDITVKGFSEKMRLPQESDDKYDGLECDVLVIGGGVTGCAVARELRRHKLSVFLAEKGSDVASGQSNRNGGVVHVGINFSAKSQKFKYCVRGNEMYRQLCEDLQVPFENKGQVTFARTKLEMLILKFVQLSGRTKGIRKTKLMSREELLSIEPCVPEWSVGGLFMGTGGITCPHGITVALAENAVENGAVIALNTAVLDMERDGDTIKSVTTNKGVIYPKTVVNAAGVYSDVIADMARDRTFTIHPRIGTDIIMDKKVGWMANTSMGKTPFTLSPEQIKHIPKDPVSMLKAIIKNLKSHSKGVGLIHSVDGNLLIGPNADESMSREDFSTSREVVENIIKVQQEVATELKASDVIAYFTGVRSPTYEEDFVVRKGIMTRNIFEAAGIQSPGLTAAPAIAVDIAKWVRESIQDNFGAVEDNPDFCPKRKYRPVLSKLSYEERNALIEQNPDYGEIVCRCEEISKGEILDALRSPLPVYSVDGIKRRVRPGMGRCQGGFCMPLVMKIIAEESGVELKSVVKSSSDSEILYGATK